MRRVLIVDDDRLFADSVCDELRPQGYEVDGVADPAGLTAALLHEPAHVVLLDVRLGGPAGGGPGLDGLELIPEILTAWPSTRIIVVTGYLSAEVVRRAYSAGAVDLLRKDEVLAEMLRFKVRRAADDADRAFAADPDQRERALREAWTECQRETDRYRKGVALERVVAMVLASVPGLGSHQRVTNGTEEFDLVVTNQSRDPFLQQQGPVWLVECKNWSTAVGVPEVRPLLEKMRNRPGRCRLGLAISLNGFAKTASEDLLRASRDEHLVVLVDGSALGEWISTPDRVGWLIHRIAAATTR